MTQLHVAQRALMTGLAFGALAIAAPAMAETHPIMTSGLWTAYAGTGTDNRAVCGVETVGLEGRRITVQQYAGQPGVDLFLTKDSWSVPAGTPTDLRIQFDYSSPFNAQATGSGTRLTVNMTFEQSVPFMRALRWGRQIRVIFPSGNEMPWTGGLNGSSRSIDAFNGCRSSFAPPAPAAPTQPVIPAPGAGAAPAAPTQPVMAAPAASAPTSQLNGTVAAPPGQVMPASPDSQPSALPPIPQAPAAPR